MKANPTEPMTIDEYIAGFPKDVQEVLRQVRLTIKKAAPDAEETIKYKIPTFVLKGNLLSFAGYKGHVGFYPTPAGTAKFQKDIAVYKAAKSSLRFPLDAPMPFDLIRDAVKYRVKEHLASVTAKTKEKTKK